MCEELDTLENAIDLITKASEEFKNIPEKLSKVDKERNDILHILELSKSLSAPDLVKLAIELRNVLRRRRELKNKKQLYAPFKYFIDMNDNVVENLNKTKNNIQKANNTINASCYTPNIRYDLASQFAEDEERIVSDYDDNDLEKLKSTLESNNV